MNDEQDVNTVPSTTDWQTALVTERTQIALSVLPVLMGVGVLLTGFFVGVFFMLGRPWQWIWMILEVALAVAFIGLAYLLARRGHLAAAVYMTILATSLTSVIGPALVEGMVVPGIFSGWLGIMFARLLAGRRENRVVVLISGAALATGIVLAGFRVFEILPIPTWIQATVGVLAVVLTLSMAASILDSRDLRYENSLARADEYAKGLKAQRVTLEEYTRNLVRRAHYQEATAMVARDVTSVLDSQELLSRVVTLIGAQFGFYHAGVFLLDGTGEYAVLSAASSEGGRRMLARGHRLRVGEEGIVGYVAEHGESRVALDVGADAMFFNNPDLPDTRSEIALPLRARGEIIGALDVQSTEPEAFSGEDAVVLQTLADQVATAISNAQLFQQAQEGMEAERKAYGELGREAWINLLRTRSDLGYRYEQQKVVPVGNVVAETVHPDEKLPELTLPVKYRGQTLGTIVAHKGTDARGWTPEEIALMETLSDQLSTALDSARLYQDSQHRAARERLTGEITARIRESLDIETVLKTTASEMRQALDLDKLVIRLATPETDTSKPARERT